MNDWILVTGFGPFPGVDRNPAHVLAQQLAETQFPQLDVIVRVLDVSFERSAEQMHSCLSQKNSAPRALIHFGVSRDPQFRLEHRAINCKRASVPDVDGAHFNGAPIDDNYELVLEHLPRIETTFPKLQGAMKRHRQ